MGKRNHRESCRAGIFLSGEEWKSNWCRILHMGNNNKTPDTQAWLNDRAECVETIYESEQQFESIQLPYLSFIDFFLCFGKIIYCCVYIDRLKPAFICIFS